MRIAFVASEYPPEAHGGIGSFVKAIAPRLIAAGHDVIVVGLGQETTTWKDGAVDIVRIGKTSLRGVAWLINRLRLRRWLEAQEDLDIIEVPDFEGLLPFQVRSPASVVVRLHLSATNIARQAGRSPGLLLKTCERRGLSLHRDWIAVSNHALHLTQGTFGIVPRHTKVVYSPLAEFPADVPVVQEVPLRYILFGGSVSARKGVLVLADAARTVLQAVADAHLVFAGPLDTHGSGDIRQQILDRAGASVSERVHFLGRVPMAQMRAMMARADVFAFPSSLETFGLVVAEAMSVGCAVVVPGCAPFDEFVTHGRSGWMVPPGDSAPLAEALVTLLEDSEARRSLGRGGQEAICQLASPDKAVKETLEFYEKVLADR